MNIEKLWNKYSTPVWDFVQTLRDFYGDDPDELLDQAEEALLASDDIPKEYIEPFLEHVKNYIDKEERERQDKESFGSKIKEMLSNVPFYSDYAKIVKVFMEESETGRDGLVDVIEEYLNDFFKEV